MMSKSKFIFIFGLLSSPLLASDCIKEGESVPVYPGAPNCCQGLHFEAPANNLLGFSGSCEKNTKRHPSADQKNEEKVEITPTLPNQKIK
ncbi:MAG: hypothetical protein JNM93_08825 [Bacteriovoracaceae bacterium]|nr:hypothetical protein [Bacteriovoracaceae bacterium]